MMKNKTLLYLFGAAILLYVVFVFMQRSSVPVAKEEFLVKIDSAKVVEITIAKDANTVTLAKRDTSWFLTNPIEYRANDRFVKQLLEKLDEMRVESVVTTNKDRWQEFEVDTAGTQVTVTQQNGKPATFILGKAASGYRHTYGRLAEETKVKLIRGTYGLVLNRTLENWRDKKILPAQQIDIVGIQSETIHLTRESSSTNAWYLVNPDGSIDTTDVSKSNKIQGALGRLQTSGFPTPEDYSKVNFDKPTSTLRVTLNNGVEHTLRFYKSEEETVRYYITLDGDTSNVFRIYEGIYKQLFKEKSELMPDPPKAGEAA